MKALFRKAGIDRIVPLVTEWKVNHAVCIIIPTCATPKVTAKTIQTLYQLHSEPAFDIVIIDNGGMDYAEIRETISNTPNARLQIVAVAENLGSAGSQYLGMKMALDRGYEVLVLSDNDAEMETPEGIHLLLDSLKTEDIVLPANKSRGNKPRNLPYEASFHYFTLKAAVAVQLGLPDPFFFLNGDDVEYAMRAQKMGFVMREIPQVCIRHWLLKPVLLTNQTRYFTIRNYLYLALSGKMNFRQRMRVLLFLICYLVIEGIHSLQMKDATLFKSAIIGLKDCIDGNLRLAIQPTAIKYEWLAVDAAEREGSAEFRPLVNRVFLKKIYRVPGLDGGHAFFGRADSPN